MAAPGAEPDTFLMTALTGKVKTPTLFLLLAGLIMVVTLWTSKKARSVTKTEINLARQDSGYERFGSSIFARSLVRRANNFSKTFQNILPVAIQNKIENQFNQVEYQKQQTALGSEAPYFDMIRASVNLVVASILISFATSLKLPLSTTYVTFMVAMGTSLSDKAWGRDSAVYRITGVFSVIGGWFFTAFSAFTVAFLIAIVIKYGGFVAILILVGLAMFFVYRTHVIHKKRYKESETLEGTEYEEIITVDKIITKCSNNIVQLFTQISEILNSTIVGLSQEDLKQLRKTSREVEKINKKTKALKDNISDTISHLEESSIDTGHYYVQVLDYLREMAHSISFLNKPCLDHVDNNHKALLEVQVEELTDMTRMIREFVRQVNQIINDNDTNQIPEVIEKQSRILKFIDTSRKKQVKRIKANEVGTRNSMLFLGILSESKSLMLQSVNVLKSYRDFTDYVNGNTEVY